MKITLPIGIDLGYWYDVLAELVDVAPHLEATFAVHRGATTPYLGLWAVTHVETGFIATPPKPTKALAVSYARKYLAEKTPRDLAAAVEAAIKREPLASELQNNQLLDNRTRTP